jgi:hypothetical protein
MAQQFATDSGVLTIPGAYPIVKVQNNPSGLATTGVLMVVGEADSGPSYAEESDLSLNAFGPDQIGDVVAKYRSGPIVDAFRGAVAASNDTGITGSFGRFLVAKTNTSAKATGTIPAIGGGTYANISDKSTGKSGNLISRVLTSATTEVVPSTGNIVLCPPQVSTDVAFRVNGGAEVTASFSAANSPTTMAAAISALAGVVATGGVDRLTVNAVAGSLTVAVVSGYAVTFTITGATYNVLPSVGDILYVPTGSPLATANEGTYVVTAAAGTVISARKLLDAAGAGSALTAPTAEGPIAIAATTDLKCYSPVVISNEAGVVVPGLGKSLEVANTSTGNFGSIAYVFTSATASPPAANATFVSTSVVPTVITSSAEYGVSINTAKQSDNISETVTVQGQVWLTLGYTGTTASAVISAGVMTITVTGGAGASQTITLADYPTIADLCQYLNSLTGYTAAPATTALGQKASTSLDAGTYTIATKHGAKTGRIKADGYRFLTEVNSGNILVDISAVIPATALVGLPDVASLAFLSGGARGATTDAAVLGALDALKACRGNFVIPLFSRDASFDITDGITDAASTYTIDSINTNARAHVLEMSQMKKRRPRQAFVSCRDTFTNAKNKAGNMASSRVYMGFQDVKDTNSAGVLTQFQPWMQAVKAAGMQAAGFYRPIVNKLVNVSGVLHPGGGFNDQLDSNIEDALKAGLNPAVRAESGGYRWISDQTTYTRDDNFVFNSVQAVYVSDIIAQTVAQRMELAFVGQSVADVSSVVAKAALDRIMGDILRLKLTAPSDDGALGGYKNASIKINGPSMVVSLEAKLAGALYFIPITFLVTPVQQSA